jgi:3-hydroxyisobutyrate dehydrogenase-like beta-hydroxyacid dehydrogenase
MKSIESDQRVGVIGLGLMGTAIVDRLLEHQYVPYVWNRTQEKAEPFLHRGAVWSDNPIAECDRVIVSLYSSEVVESVLQRWKCRLRPGQILIDTTTGDPEQSLIWEQRLMEFGASYLDAPISGSSEQTRRGEATVIVSGQQSAYDACHDLWPALGRNVFYVGACGNAAKMKLVSNLVLGLNRAALAEGLVFAESIGIDPGSALDVLRGSAAYSRQMDTKGRKMIDGDFTAQAKLSQHLKDVRLMLHAASAAGLNLPLADTHHRLLEHAEALNLGELDNSAIIEAIRRPTRID